MKYLSYIIILSFFFITTACNDEPTVVVVEPPYKAELRGMDISFYPEMELFGTKFYDSSGVERPFLDIIKENGVNLVRIRLWNDPAGVHSGFQEVSSLALRCKEKGFKILLDFHYSDTWADPGNQAPPATWKELSIDVLKDSVYNFTKHVLTAIRPEYVQIGNEINNGFLWNKGSISEEKNFTDLLKEGVRASREVDPKAKIMIHFAGHEGSDDFYDILEKNKLDYDIIGLSYYPLWHGKSIPALENRLNSLKAKYKKEIFIAEFSYPFTLQYDDLTNNIIGFQDQLINGFPATRAGQKIFVEEMKKVTERTFGLGFCYWGGEWVAFKGSNSGVGSSYENQALFDFEHKANPALGEFRGAH